MKTTYQCEKCGHRSGDWDEIRKCENNHIEPWTVESGSRWGGGELYPEYASVIIVNMRERSGEGYRPAVYVLDENATEKLHQDMKRETEQEERMAV